MAQLCAFWTPVDQVTYSRRKGIVVLRMIFWAPWTVLKVPEDFRRMIARLKEDTNLELQGFCSFTTTVKEHPAIPMLSPFMEEFPMVWLQFGESLGEECTLQVVQLGPTPLLELQDLCLACDECTLCVFVPKMAQCIHPPPDLGHVGNHPTVINVLYVEILQRWLNATLPSCLTCNNKVGGCLWEIEPLPAGSF